MFTGKLLCIFETGTTISLYALMGIKVMVGSFYHK